VIYKKAFNKDFLDGNMPEENIDVEPYNYKKFQMDPEEISKPIFPYDKKKY
jgi:hypothetical protein